MEPHALVRLHGCGHWLRRLLDELWCSTALKNFNLEIDIRMERNWFTSYWWPGISITIGIE